ncbi:putative VWFA domain-containing protein [Gammaproteobacteria bacterium]
MKTILKALLGGLELIVSLPLAAAMLVNIVIDGTVSVTDSDFDREKQAVINFLDGCYAKAQSRPGLLTDFVSVNIFGGKDQYRGFPFINCNNHVEIMNLTSELTRYKHPKYVSTGIYSAIQKGIYELQIKRKILPRQYIYLKTLVVVTDSRDKDSPNDVKDKVTNYDRGLCDDVFFYLIGIGAGGQLGIQEFNNVADKTLLIGSFGDLKEPLVGVLTLLSD